MKKYSAQIRIFLFIVIMSNGLYADEVTWNEVKDNESIIGWYRYHTGLSGYVAKCNKNLNENSQEIEKKFFISEKKAIKNINNYCQSK